MRFTPRNAQFYDLLTEAATNLLDGAKVLVEWAAAELPDRVDLAKSMRQIEHAGDDATHNIMYQLNSTFVTPFDREDIHRLASRLDDVLDYMETAVDLAALYRIERLPAEVTDQARILLSAAELTAAAMPRLRNMRDLPAYWIEINELENEADKIYRGMLARLFDGHLEALSVIKVKEIIDPLEAAADAFEHVADTVQSIAVKES